MPGQARVETAVERQEDDDLAHRASLRQEVDLANRSLRRKRTAPAPQLAPRMLRARTKAPDEEVGPAVQKLVLDSPLVGEGGGGRVRVRDQRAIAGAGRVERGREAGVGVVPL